MSRSAFSMISPKLVKLASYLPLLLIPMMAVAGEIVLPSPVLERDAVVPVVYRMSQPATGHGTVAIRWSDSLGRVVEERTISVDLVDESEITFPLDTHRALAMRNEIQVHLTVEGKTLEGKADHRDEDAHATFVARPKDARWRDYEIIMWQSYPRELLPALQKIGIDAGEYSGRSQSAPESLVENNMRWYAENIGTDFYSEYHRWRPDRSVDWSFLQARAAYRKDPTNKEILKRHPSFWDPVWRTTIHDRLVDSARRNSPYRPVFYSLADESGIADLAAFWDFDLSDQSLVPMRRWLQRRYTTLAALNREWETDFAKWDAVTPLTTHEAMQRKGDNFAPWADFKEWMDISYANALKMGTDAIHEVDKDAYVAIGGAQMPGWGGYDYSRLTQALTAVEPYDIGNNVEIIRSLNPNMPMLTTAFAHGNWEKHRVWRELLHGNRGLIIWDDKQEYVGKDGKPGPRGLEAATYYNELRNGIAAQIINSESVADPIAIHYSQASMRTDWMLARRPEGDAWVNRGASKERTDNEFMRLRESWCRLIEDEGLQYNFVSYSQLEDGELLKRGYRVFVLPRSSSLSQAEVEAIRSFVANGGVVIADGEPGLFDEHSRRLPAGSLADLFAGSHDGPATVRTFGRGKAIFLKTDTLNYHQDRLVNKEGPVQKLVGDLLRSNGIRPEFTISDATGQPPVGVEMHVFRNGGVRLITLLSNPQMRVDELGPPDFRSNARFEKPVTFKLSLPSAMNVYDLRRAESLGLKRELMVKLDPYEPTIFSVAQTPITKLDVMAPAEIQRGSTARIGISCPRSSASAEVFHIEVTDPKGNDVPFYSENLIADHGRAIKLLPFALSDAAGTWTLRIHDMLSAQTTTETITVQ